MGTGQRGQEGEGNDSQNMTGVGVHPFVKEVGTAAGKSGAKSCTCGTRVFGGGVETAVTAINALTSAGTAPGADGLPEGVREGNENLLVLTPAAGAKVAALIPRENQGEYLRVAITGGGCNGLSYKMKFVPAPKRGDILVRTAGVRVLVDSKSALYIKGTHLDYSSAMVAGGFKFSNPNAKASCSCGESFSV